MDRRIEYCSAAAGAVLLLSGYAKALDAAAFGTTLARYGSDTLYWAAPVVVLTDLFLGFSLLLGLRLRKTGAAATLFLAAVTGVYVYGLVFREVADCGCFGAGSVFNGPPVATFVRNALLAGLTFAVWRGGDDRPLICSAAGGLLPGACARALSCPATRCARGRRPVSGCMSSRRPMPWPTRRLRTWSGAPPILPAWSSPFPTLVRTASIRSRTSSVTNLRGVWIAWSGWRLKMRRPNGVFVPFSTPNFR